MFQPKSSSLHWCAGKLSALSEDQLAFPRFAFQFDWGVELIVDVRGDDGRIQARYRIRAKNPCSFRLFEGSMAEVLYVEEHAVLSEAIEPEAELTFYGRCRSPREVVGALYAAHLGWSNGWLPFDQFLRRDVRLLQLLDGCYGQLAVGPLSYIRALAQTIRPYELRERILERPVRPNPKASVSGLLLGRNFVWGHDVRAEAIDPTVPFDMLAASNG